MPRPQLDVEELVYICSALEHVKDKNTKEERLLTRLSRLVEAYNPGPDVAKPRHPDVPGQTTFAQP